jgi:hypothetical protein
MKKFENIIKTIQEDMVAGGTESAFTGGAAPISIGGYGGAVGNKDTYAPGDARVPTSIFGNRKKRRNKKQGNNFIGTIDHKISTTGNPMVFKRSKIEKMFLNSVKQPIKDPNKLLVCGVVIKNPQFVNLIKSIIEKNEIKYDIQHVGNEQVIIFESKNRGIEKILSEITSFIGDNIMESCHGIWSFITEMTKEEALKRFPKEMKKGTKVEKEHAKTVGADKFPYIATDHLSEFPDIPDGENYYHELEKTEDILKKREQKYVKQKQKQG